MISCFMVIRNGVDLGYPFIEAITSSLPVCDEIHVSEGYSDDNTYKVLTEVFKNNSRVILHRDHWDKTSNKGSAIRNALNKVRDRCNGEYILEVDANEIIPPEDVGIIKRIPEIYPDKDLFAFPYYQILGSQILFTEEFRFRFARNIRSIKVMWDGYTMGHHLDLSTLFNFGTIKRLANRLLTVFLEERVSGGFTPEYYIYLPIPIFRYYSIFPENFFKKMASKLFFQPGKDYSELVSKEDNKELENIWNNYELNGKYQEFWESILSFHQKKIRAGVKLNKEFIENRRIPEKDQPEVIQKQFGKKQYSINR